MTTSIMNPRRDSDASSDGHMEVRRNGRVKRTYKCRHCARLFKRSEHCTRHERVHTHEKPFACAYCKKNYARKDLVKRHERTLHAEEYRRAHPGEFGGDSSQGSDSSPVEASETTKARRRRSSAVVSMSEGVSSMSDALSSVRPPLKVDTMAMPPTLNPFEMSPSGYDALSYLPELSGDLTSISDHFPVQMDAYLDQLPLPDMPALYPAGEPMDFASPQKQHPEIDPFLIALSSPLGSRLDATADLHVPHYWLPSSAIDPALEEAYFATMSTV